MEHKEEIKKKNNHKLIAAGRRPQEVNWSDATLRAGSAF